MVIHHLIQVNTFNEKSFVKKQLQLQMIKPIFNKTLKFPQKQKLYLSVHEGINH